MITVPAFFNQAERRAVLHAARMADLKVLQLINDNTAVALNYGVFRRKDINATAQVSAAGSRRAACLLVPSPSTGENNSEFLKKTEMLCFLTYEMTEKVFLSRVTLSI